MSSEERSCENCDHQVGRLTEHPECERCDDMDCVLNGYMNWQPREKVSSMGDEKNRCPKCGAPMTGYTDYDGLQEMSNGSTVKQVRRGYMCTNLECGHEEKVSK